MKRLLWIIPEKSGGIRSYGDALWPAVKVQWESQHGHVALDPLYELPTAQEVEKLEPDVIHVQHEFGLFGSKIPGFYTFPKWVRGVRRVLPDVKIYATAHSVLGPQYKYPWRATGFQMLLRQAANLVLVPLMRETWLKKTWGILDGVVVHSTLQLGIIKNTGCPQVADIPHFVFERRAPTPVGLPDTAEILVFGYVSLEKGQDIAIRALARVKTPCKLIIAGGIRRDADSGFLSRCERLVEKLGLSKKVLITGYVESAEIDKFYGRAALVLAPFRDTSGSGTLAQALSRGAPILASDLPLNRELNRRVEGCLSLFKSEDVEDCAKKIDELLTHPSARSEIKARALKYAGEFSIEKTALRYLEFYR